MTLIIKSLETKRLKLIPLIPEHADLMFEPYCDEKLYQYLEKDIPESKQWLREQFAIISKRTIVNRLGKTLLLFDWSLFCKETNAVVGRSEFTIDEEGMCNVAYVVFRKHWNQGYALEATICGLDFLKNHPKIKKFKICCDTWNIASNRIAHKLNFKFMRIDLGVNQLEDRIGDDNVYELNLTQDL